MKKTCYVTTPIYYSSGNAHIGTSYTTIACDVFARFHRSLGYDTLFLTGMDEHGQKIEEAAAKLGKSPQQLVDELGVTTKSLWKEIKISFDDFIRTSEERHIKVVQKIFAKLQQNDDIYLGYYEGDYCVSCEAFFTKTQLVDGIYCPDCGKLTRKVKEESYFLRLTKYQKRLLDFIKVNPQFIQPESRRNEVVAFIERGLEDLAVSRTSFTWGVPVLDNPKHVVYVWIDALSNYLSALGYLSDNDELYKKYWVNGNKVVHVIGKDIVRFHAIYWPIILMALDVPVNFNLYVHGWVLMKDGKMSKSVGNTIYPRDVIKKFGLDALRFNLIKEMPLGNDSIFSYDRFIEKYNADLANDLGNLLSRVVAMINKYFSGKVSKPKTNHYSFDNELEATINNSTEQYLKNFENFRFQTGLNAVWDLINRANKYIDETVPWIVAKDKTNNEKLNGIMYHLFESIRLVAIMIAPVMPDTAKIMFSQLGISEQSMKNLKYGITKEAVVTTEPKILFKRLDPKEVLIEEKIIMTNENKQYITIEDFNKLDLRVGEIISASKIEKSDQLLLLKVLVEGKERQIVSGLAKAYEPEALKGKKVIVVANLKPIKLRGYISEGMVLTAEGKDLRLEILEVKKHNSFSKVT